MSKAKETLKCCGGCGENKPAENFSRNRLAKDGRQWHCKQCMSDHGKVRKRGIKEGWWQVTKKVAV